ncbi:MAG: redoxin domain-containing protein [Anaerolineae bacterium]|nr:redoxin domain-containing protein [Anaerolineae bacterium]MCB9108015.1 redoxin domain-containing protein [Anaerolineales bacterium]
MLNRTHIAVMLVAMMIVIGYQVVAAAPPPEGSANGQDYIVQADDWLSKLADKFYGDPLAYQAIVEATNAKAVADTTYTQITDPDVIEVGQRLFIPDNLQAVADLTTLPQESPVVAEDPAQDQTVGSEEVAMINQDIPAPTAEQLALLADLDIKGVPPDLNNEVWLNSDPLKLADLHGKVVIVEFWTFGCINCIHVIPSLREWHTKYADDGLVIIGVHTPEFGYEQDLDNVKEALVRLDVPYAVAIDNDWQTWRSYKKPFNQRYWPSKYFIDKAGNVRHIHIGEGRYDQQEEIIQALLAEDI